MQSTTGKFYITTAINYTNGAPHFGHAYEAIAADYLARYNRVAGKEVFFLTGTDEHGQKVAESAEREKLEPIQLCDKYVALFQALNEKLSISNNFFIRTTHEKHIKTSQWLWKKAVAKGDIYLGAYEGWYNTREEAFVTETEAKAANYIDADSGNPLVKTKESSYFFKMSKYQEALINHINANPEFILPEERRNEMLTRLKEPLLDLSCSRTTFSWGIPVPESTADEKHIMYVWFDALTNYLSGVDYAENGDLSKFWPADVHIIGKDICWFHTVIWPCMLLSCEIPLPKTIFCHGFICGPDGRKMSKSLGNVVDPNDVLKEHTSDALRYFALREGGFGHDINYNPKGLLERHDSELQASLGNLAQRGLKLCESECGGKIPEQVAYEIFNIEELRTKVDQAIAKFNIQGAIELVFEQLRFVNNWIAEKAPWKMKSADQKDEKQKVIKTVLEAMYVLGHLLFPVIPTAMGKLFANLGTPATTLPLLTTWSNLKPGTTISCTEQLFPRVGESRFEKKKGAQPAAAGGAAPAAGAQPKKAGGGPQPGGGKGKGAAAAAPEVLDAKKVDLRVCKILKAEPHPKAGHLYVESIDCGDASGPRQVVSGLAKFIPLDQMQNRIIVCVCNMKPDKFQGVQSEAMVLCASNADHTVVEFVEPPADAKIGERIAIEGYVLATDPNPPQLNPKKKEWQAIAPDYKTNDKMQACYKGIVLMTSAGPCTSKLADAPLG